MPPSHKKSRGKQKRVGAPAFPANHRVAGAAAAAWAPLAASNVGPCLRSLTGPAFCWLQRLATCSTIDIVGPGRVTREELATGNLTTSTPCVASCVACSACARAEADRWALKITRCHRLRTLQEDTAVMRALTPQVAPADLLCRSYTKLNEASCSPSALGFSLSSLPNFTRALPGHTRRRAPVWRPRRGGGHGQRGGGGVPTRYKQAGASARRDGASHAGGCIVT